MITFVHKEVIRIAEKRTKEIRIIIPEDLFAVFTPKKVLKHLINAKKETLLTLKSLINAKIGALEKKEEKRPAKKAKVNAEKSSLKGRNKRSI